MEPLSVHFVSSTVFSVFVYSDDSVHHDDVVFDLESVCSLLISDLLIRCFSNSFCFQIMYVLSVLFLNG